MNNQLWFGFSFGRRFEHYVIEHEIPCSQMQDYYALLIAIRDGEISLIDPEPTQPGESNITPSVVLESDKELAALILEQHQNVLDNSL